MAKDRKLKLFEKTADVFNVPGEIAGGIYRVTVTAGRRVLIENHRGILEYESDTVRVNCGSTIVKISGQELEVASMSPADMLVTGTVFSVSFER